jgi:hypothetical protein
VARILCAFHASVQERPQRFTITAASPVVRILSISVKDVREHIAPKTLTSLIHMAKKQDNLRAHLAGSILDARRQLGEERRETVMGSEVRTLLCFHSAFAVGLSSSAHTLTMGWHLPRSRNAPGAAGVPAVHTHVAASAARHAGQGGAPVPAAVHARGTHVYCSAVRHPKPFAVCGLPVLRTHTSPYAVGVSPDG